MKARFSHYYHSRISGHQTLTFSGLCLYILYSFGSVTPNYMQVSSPHLTHCQGDLISLTACP